MDIKIRNKFIEIKNSISDWFVICIQGTCIEDDMLETIVHNVYPGSTAMFVSRVYVF